MNDDGQLIRQAIELARAALTTGDEGYEEVWPLLSDVARHGNSALALGAALLDQPDLAEQAIGCDLLGLIAEIDADGRKQDAVTALLAFADRELDRAAPDQDLQWSIARALGRAWDPRAVPVLLALADHPDAQVRHLVAGGLFAAMSGGVPDPAGLSALIALTRDPDGEIRNWATFGLGSILAADSAEIRAALWDRVGDEHAEAREEGICGLACRRDPRSVELMARLLADEAGARLVVFGAAQLLGAPELVPYLEGYDPDDPGVADALAACREDRMSQAS